MRVCRVLATGREQRDGWDIQTSGGERLLRILALVYGRLGAVLSLRAVTADDWPVWRDLRLAALAEAPRAFKSRLEDWQLGGEERWRSRLELPDTFNIVALLDGGAVGMASGIPRPDGVCELRSIWVSPQARGRGVGDQLIAAVETWARQSGAWTLKLAVISGNEPAIALYRRNGFVMTAELGGLSPDGATRERVMVKTLRLSQCARQACRGRHCPEHAVIETTGRRSGCVVSWRGAARVPAVQAHRIRCLPDRPSPPR
jgi:ribosomal protein S18 acetylase RimI-like enzyme